MKISVLSDMAVIRAVSACGSSTMVSSCGRYTAISPRNIRFLPLMKPIERITVRKAVCCGYLASRKGTAMKLSLSDSHSKADTAVRNTAFAARKTSVVRSLPRSSI